MMHERIVILGGGVIGSSIAYFLSKKGAKPIVVERCSVICSASSKAGGFLALNWCDSSDLGPLARRSFQLHSQLPSELGTDYGFRNLDTLEISSCDKGVKYRKQQKIETDPPSWITGAVLSSEKIGTTETTAQVHPALFTQALINGAKERGAELIIGTVEGISYEGGKVRGVLVDGKIIPCSNLVIALGPWSANINEWLPEFDIPKITSVKAHSVVSRPTQLFSPHALFLTYATEEGKTETPEVYPRNDGTVYMCGMSENFARLPPDPNEVVPTEKKCEQLHKMARELYNCGEIETAQACFLPTTKDSLPLIGRLPFLEGLYIATGHSCWGILNSPATGEAIAELIIDGKTSIDLSPFDPARFQKSGTKTSRKKMGDMSE